MVPLLSFDDVSKRYRDGEREIVVLDRVFLELAPGARAGVYGARRSGKSTLLRLAAGVVAPDGGSVRFGGADMAAMSAGERARLLRREIALMSAADWRPNPGESVLECVATSLGSEGLTMREAKRRARDVLELLGIAGPDTGEPTAALSLADSMRVMLARSLARSPRLLIVDEPAVMANLRERERFLSLLRGAVAERGTALLLASEEMAALQGLDTLMSIADGEVCSSGGGGTVVALPLRRRAAAERP